MTSKKNYEAVAQIICDAGGTLVGRTRLQKVAYLLEAAGLGCGFHFSYHYYGPYSEELAEAAVQARAFGNIQEVEKPTTWGSTYSIYTTKGSSFTENPDRKNLITRAAEADATDLELAATAAYLFKQGNDEPWVAVQRLKSDKAVNHLESAKKLYSDLRSTVKQLPDI